MAMPQRPVRIVAVQTGPASPDKQTTVESNLELLAQAAEEKPDFVVFPELSTTQYFPAGPHDPKCFDWAEPVPGPTTNRFAERAKAYGCYIILPMYEKGDSEGEYYNSAVLISPDGKVVPGTLPGGQHVKCARKNHLALVDFMGFTLNEPFYMMRQGPGYPLFKTDKATIGILICYDRWFPESWRTLALTGADIIFVPLASCYGASGGGGEVLPWSFRIWAHENLLFAVGCNKAGVENVGKEITYYGLSCVASPAGQIVQQGPEASGPAIVSATVDLSQIASIRKGMPYFRDRRPEIDNLENLPGWESQSR
jgi:N-carbamoylputrescine amidase